MSSRLAKFIALLAAVQILGGHWMALQSVAWVGMLAKYSQEQSLVEAIEKTFDGEHMCKLCHVVKEGQDQEQKQPQVKMMLKLEAVLTVASPLPEPMFEERQFTEYSPALIARNHAPPTPPPLA